MNFSDASVVVLLMMNSLVCGQLFFTDEPKNIEMRFPSLSIRHHGCFAGNARLALEFLIR
jgi:hypothetical protein